MAKITADWLEQKRDAKMLSKLITDNRITMISAPPANGKSSLALANIDEILTNYPGKRVMYFDYDAGIHRTKDGLFDKFIKNDMIDAYSIETSEEHEQYMKGLKELKNSENCVVFIDGFQSYVSRMGGEINDNTTMSLIMSDLKELRSDKNLTIVLIHHNNKQDKTGWSVYRGAQVVEDSLDSLLYLKGTITSKTTMDIEVQVAKFDGMELYKGMSVKLSLLEDGTALYVDDSAIVVTYPRGVDETKLLESIQVHVGESKSVIMYSVAADLGIGVNKALTAVNTAIEAGKFRLNSIGDKNKQIIVKGDE